MESIRKIRDTEIDIIRYIAKLWALVNFTFISVPFLMTLTTSSPPRSSLFRWLCST
jgi:hypothetical protein